MGCIVTTVEDFFEALNRVCSFDESAGSARVRFCYEEGLREVSEHLAGPLDEYQLRLGQRMSIGVVDRELQGEVGSKQLAYV